MDFKFSEEHEILRREIRRFAEEEIKPIVDEYEEREESPVHLFPKLGELGYLCPTYSQKYGAAEMGFIGECIITEELAKVCVGIAAMFVVQNGIGTSVIYNHGSEEQRQKYVVPAIKGQKISAFALTESNAGSDIASMETTAAKKDGNYILTGNKIYTSNGPIADFVTVAAYTDKGKGPREGISIFIVENGMPGFTVTKMRKVGNRSTSTGELFFDEIKIPTDNLVGQEGKGFRYLMETLNEGRIIHAFETLGEAEAAFEASLEYAKNRVQFGQPIGKFQAVAFKLARMAMDIEAAKWLSYYAAWLYEQGEKRCRMEVSMAKLFASEMAQRVTSEAMQIHGGVGYMMDSPVQRFWRDARLHTITDGTSEIQELIISRELGL